MDWTSGFAASIAIRQELIQSLVRVLYNAGQLNHFIRVNTPTISADLFLSLPTLTYPPNSGNRLAIDLYAWGPMTVTPPGGSSEQRKVKFRARVLVGQTVSIQTVIGADGFPSRSLVFGLDGPSASVASFQIDPYAGGLFSDAATTYLLSPDFQTLLTVGLQLQIGALGQLIPPLDISFLGAIAIDPSTTIQLKTVEEALILGLDIDSNGVTTHGSVDGLADTSGGNHLGMWTRPSVVPIAYADVRRQIEDKVAEQDATLDSYEIRVEEGWFRIGGSASKTGGSVNFSLHAVPKLIKPGVHYEWDEEYGEHFEYSTPDREVLWFDPQDVVVDVDKDWWVVLGEAIVGIVTVGIGVLVVESIVDMVRGNVSSAIGQNTQSRADRNQQYMIPGVVRPPIQLRIEEFECHNEGIFVGITIKPQFWAGRLDGPTVITAEEALVETVAYRVDLPPDALFDDPELRVHWTVRRTDTNAILISRDTIVFANLTLAFDHNVVPFLDIDQLSIEVRVYRTLGAGSEDIFYQIQYLRIVDYVDRTHPYVQWSHQAMVPLVRVEPDGSHTILGNHMVARRSAIHRTALPGRCRMLRRYSTTKLFPPDWRGFPLEYSDTLPFPLSEIMANRSLLCDYCFFGGPTKDVPLIPIP